MVRCVLAILLLLPLHQIVFDDVGIDVSAARGRHIPRGSLRFPPSPGGLLEGVLLWRRAPFVLVLGRPSCDLDPPRLGSLHKTFLETLNVLEEDLLLGLLGPELLLLMLQLDFKALEIDA